MGKTIKQLAKEERRYYFHKWREENKDKVKKYNDNYWKKRAWQKSNEIGDDK